MDVLEKLIQLLAGVATIAGVAGIWVAYGQWKSGIRGQQEATALGIFKDYLQLALAHPDLASPAPDIHTLGRRSADFRRYEWFVAVMLFACEQIVALQPKDREWRSSVADHLNIHRHYLASSHFNSDRYSSELRQLISGAVRSIEAPDAIPSGALNSAPPPA
jgi:Na+-translocating ferredoxin:NAD+ oxidoreductase RnfD subunit